MIDDPIDAYVAAHSQIVYALCQGMITGRGGLWGSSVHDVDAAVVRFVHMLYADQPETTFPINNKTPRESSRNAEMIAAYEAGTSLGELAERYGITEQRVHQIVNCRRT